MFRWCMTWWLAWAASLLLAFPAAAEPIPLERDSGALSLASRAVYWVEDGRALSADQVEARASSLPWRVRQPGQSHFIDGKALWIRFEAVVHDSDRWYLVVGSSGIDRVQLFYRNPTSGQWVVQEAGDSRRVSLWPVPGRAPTFELAPAVGQPVTYWVRVEHDRVDFAASLDLYDQAQLLAVREREQFLLGAYFGLAALLSLVSVANAIGMRDRNFAAYAVYLIVFSLGQAAYVGVGAQHLWDSLLPWNAISTFLLPALSAAAALWFVQVVTEPARFSRRLNQAVTLLIGALLVLAAVDSLVPDRTIFFVRMVMTALAALFVALLIGLVWTRGEDPDIRLIALGFLPVLVMALFPIARGLNLIPNSALTRYGLVIGSALEMPILFYALNLRAARRREGLARASALPHTDALTGLADRRSLLQRMEASLLRARRQNHSCALLAVKLANHDAIVSEYGRDMLDRALVVTASHLRRCAADIDLAARVGEREFALLVEGPTSSGAATARAQQLVAGGLRPSPALPPDMTLRLQVVVALLPDQQADAATSLQWALAALANVRADTRKQIRPLNF